MKGLLDLTYNDGVDSSVKFLFSVRRIRKSERNCGENDNKVQNTAERKLSAAFNL